MLSDTDRMQIADLAARYSNAIDADDLDTMTESFTEDGVYEFSTFGRYHGHAEIASGIEAFISSLGHDKRHVLANLELSDGEEPDTATSRSYLIVFDRLEGPNVVATAVWTDVLRRTPDGWRYEKRHMEVDPAFYANAYGESMSGAPPAPA